MQDEFELNLIDFESAHVQTFNKTDFYNMDDEIVLSACLESNIDSISLFNPNVIIEDEKLLSIAIKKYPIFLTKLENYNENMGLKILEKDLDLIMMFPTQFKTEKICKYVVSKNYLHLKEFPLSIINNIENILHLLIISSPDTCINSIKEFYEKTIEIKVQRTKNNKFKNGLIDTKDTIIKKYKNLNGCFILMLAILITILVLFLISYVFIYYFLFDKILS